MDLLGIQLTLLVGYGNLCPAAAPRTLAGGRRDKSPPRGGTAPGIHPHRELQGSQEVLCSWALHTNLTLHHATLRLLKCVCSQQCT